MAASGGSCSTRAFVAVSRYASATPIPPSVLSYWLADPFFAGTSPVHVAAVYGHESVLRYLLDRGGDQGILDSEGSSLLHCAVTGGNCQVVRLVLSKGVDVDQPDYLGMPLLVATLNGHAQVIKILLEHGADPNKVVGVYSPLMMACSVNSLESMKLLVKAGADVNWTIASATDYFWTITEMYKYLFYRITSATDYNWTIATEDNGNQTN